MKINNIIITHLNRKTDVFIETNHIPNAKLGMIFVAVTKSNKLLYFSVTEMTKDKDTLYQIGYYGMLKDKTLEEAYDILSDVELRLATDEEAKQAKEESRYC